MTTTAYRGVVRGGVVLLEHESPLTEGTQVLVTPVSGGRGASTAIIAALESAPKVPPEWVDELEQLINEGQRPPSPPVCFPDEAGSQESA